MAPIPPELRREIVERSRQRCSYCQSQQRVVGASLTIDHIIPTSLGGVSIAHNLCLACWDCNLIKSNRITAVDPQSGEMARLFHPDLQVWREHFLWSEDGLRIAGVTAVGRATVVALRLNRPQLVRARELWTASGLHPPQD